MNAVNSAITSLFNLLMKPLGVLGPEVALVLVSGIFGILALICFKFISSQKGIKGVKDKIKGGLIQIRIYQDDLGLVARGVGTVLGRNIQYLTYNFAPILPLLVPFTFVAAQLVVRFAFAPLPVWDAEQQAQWSAGKGTTITIELAEEYAADASKLTLDLPETVEAKTKLVRIPSKGKAFIEVLPVGSGVEDIVVRIDGEEVARKQIVTGDVEAPAVMQPERVGDFLSAFLWPAEDTLSETPLKHIAFAYPERDLRFPFMPDGPVGVLLIFLVASMVFGVAILKPLNIQI